MSKYKEVATEYYNESSHPTCANFRALSLNFVASIVFGKESIGDCLEVGSGRSIAAELREIGTLDCSHLTVSDLHLEMLDHSRTFADCIDAQVQLDAQNPAELPTQFLDRFDLVIASLADPYDTEDFWQVLQQVVCFGGSVVLTTPSWEWAEKFRATEPDVAIDAARFDTCDGERWLPSHIRPPTDEITLCAKYGFIPVSITQLFMPPSGFSPPAPKLEVAAKANLSIVTGYHLIRVPK